MVNVLALSAADCGFIGGVMVNVLALSAADCGFNPQLSLYKDREIDICCFSAQYTVLLGTGIQCF